MVLHGTKRVLPRAKKGYSKGSLLRIAVEPFEVLDGTFFSKSVLWFWTLGLFQRKGSCLSQHGRLDYVGCMSVGQIPSIHTTHAAA